MADDASPTAILAAAFADPLPDAENAGIEMVRGKPYMLDHKGVLVPLEAVKAADKLEDELVRKVLAYAEPLAAQIARFRAHTFDDVDSFVAMLEQDAGVTRSGSKGNMSFSTFDGLAKVQVAVAQFSEYGPQLQVAKELIDECLLDWTDEVREEVRAMMADAFNVDQAGHISRVKLLSLRRFAFKDPRWLKAMELIAEAERPVSSKRYVRIYRRADAKAAWELVSLDVASA